MNEEGASVLTLTNSSLSGNWALVGGGLENWNVDSAIVLNSTLDHNTASAGGGVYNFRSAVTLANATLSGNSAQSGEGIINITATATLTNVTLNNSVSVTGTGHNLYLAGGSALTLTNTIVTFNPSGRFNGFGGGFPKRVSLGHNLANDTSCGLMASGDHEGPFVPILLGGLANHGGPTLTQLPHSTSAAIDVGDNAVCAAPH